MSDKKCVPGCASREEIIAATPVKMSQEFDRIVRDGGAWSVPPAPPLSPKDTRAAQHATGYAAKLNLHSPNLPTKYPDKERDKYQATRKHEQPLGRHYQP